MNEILFNILHWQEVCISDCSVSCNFTDACVVCVRVYVTVSYHFHC